MALGYIISLGVLAVSLVLLVIMGVVSWKKIKPTLNNFQEIQDVVNQHIDHFTKEADAIQEKVNHIMERVETLQQEAETKIENFNELSAHASDLGDAVTYLKDNSSDLSKGIAKNTFNELKTDGPKLAKTFSLAVKRTFQKQKARYNH